MSKRKKGKEKSFLLTEDGKTLLTENGEPILAQVAQTDLPEPDQKQPTFRIPYNLMEMQSQYKEEMVNNIILGIDLSVGEDRQVFTMSKLLHAKSEHKDESSPDFYLGNTKQDETNIIEYQLTNNKQILPQKMPVYTVSQQEYYETYLGVKPGGNDIKSINQGLDSLAQKSFALKVPVLVGKDTKGNKLYDYYEGIDHLFKVVKVVRGITETDIKKVDKGDEALRKEKGEFIFTLHPIFRHHIQNNYVNLPFDIYERIVEAAGGQIKFITPSINALRNCLFVQLRMMKIRGEDHTFSLNNDNLYKILKLEDYIRQGRKRRAIDAKNKAIQTFINLGLILHVEEVKGAEGQLKHVFTLNKDFE